MFVSEADGLSSADDDRFVNVYVRDRTLGLTTLVSRADGPAGAGANSDSSEPSISADGRWVAFQSPATNLAAGVSGAADHVYVRDLLNGTTRWSIARTAPTARSPTTARSTQPWR